MGSQAVSTDLFGQRTFVRPRGSLLKWVGNKFKVAEKIASYNADANGPDFLFLTRACYGGVIRFRKRDGYMSTPVGIHSPIKPEAFAARVDEWQSV